MTLTKGKEKNSRSATDKELGNLRNIGIMAHIDAGKTTATERMLYYSGRTYKLGEVHEGDTEMDWMDQEKERGITIQSAATTCYWRDQQVNIIDTPGHVDFTAEVERSLRVLDGAVALFSGVEMVESQSEKVWRQADKYQVPRIAFINKLDRTESRFYKTVETIEERLDVTTLPLQIPYKEEDGELKGMVNLLEMKLMVWDQESKGAEYDYRPIPEKLRERAKNWREKLLERTADLDDELMMKYLDDEEIPVSLIKNAVRKGCVESDYVPLLGGSALHNIGIQPVLNAVVDYLPSPLDIPSVEGNRFEKGEEKEKVYRGPEDEDKFTALAFKVTTDEYAGKLVYLRIYSGSVKEGERVYHPSLDRDEKISQIFHMHANHRERVEKAEAGDIVAVVGPDEIFTGDTLSSHEDPVVLGKIEFPEPVISVAIEPSTETEEGKLTDALQKLSEEDPTFEIGTDDESNQTIISGMGELHLEILVTRLKEEFGVHPHVGTPSVTYRETPASESDVVEEFVKQSGGRGHYARVEIRYEPLERGEGFAFEDNIRGGAVPKEYISSVREGIKEYLGSGPLAGCEVTDLKATLYDGDSHPVDSSDIAFKAAASRATGRALKSNTKLLEPIMEGEVISPEEYIGDVLDDISKRRGNVKGISNKDGTQTVEFDLPLAESFGYATSLRSLTQGRATYSLTFSKYRVVPESVKREVLNKRGY